MDKQWLTSEQNSTFQMRKLDLINLAAKAKVFFALLVIASFQNVQPLKL